MSNDDAPPCPERLMPEAPLLSSVPSLPPSAPLRLPLNWVEFELAAQEWHTSTLTVPVGVAAVLAGVDETMLRSRLISFLGLLIESIDTKKETQ